MTIQKYNLVSGGAVEIDSEEVAATVHQTDTIIFHLKTGIQFVCKKVAPKWRKVWEGCLVSGESFDQPEGGMGYDHEWWSPSGLLVVQQRQEIISNFASDWKGCKLEIEAYSSRQDNNHFRLCIKTQLPKRELSDALLNPTVAMFAGYMSERTITIDGMSWDITREMRLRSSSWSV